MKQPQAIFLDMDGTLLREDNYVSEETMTTIHQVRDQGIPVFIATGRGQSEILTRTPEGFCVDGIISSNGMTGYLDEELLFQHTLDFSLVKEVIEAARELEIYYEVFPTTGEGVALIQDQATLEAEISGEKPADILGSEWNERVEAISGGITWVDEIKDVGYSKFYCFSKDQKKIAQWKSRLNEIHARYPFSTSSSTPANVEIMVTEKNKATGIQGILTRLNIDPANILVMGDSFNDVPMFEYAGYSVAMKNAPDQLKAMTDDVTRFTNDENGVSDYLKTHVLS
ncbi:hypothetical protein SAMN05421839_1124 [Halolactibacillus halophilus]|uniref:Haloacid dehalogenase n=1 Tax=Halolactibacillus halophilus TaxID=306540 RepID=A0A1I5P011_9BACI|nr:HAD family hydrolase [Halolactibacillus halophilus]GEM01559.1 haloacid dehalogenase [Halolactibacillus halophilus]SFP27333.1 hypothetical protein SAMN05421839_1124 [Halolactibacillus halophilus]